MLSVLFAIIGLLVGGLINALADSLPRRAGWQRPRCARCAYIYPLTGWWALGRLWRRGGACPECALPARRRPLLVELATGALFAALPLFVPETIDLLITALYSAIFILVIVIDLEHRLILHVVTLPSTLLGLAGSLVLSNHSLLASLLGAVTGFLFFYGAYWFGQRLFGPGALGFGDVTLAMTMGAMLGVQRIFFALALAMLLGGIAALFQLLSRRSLRSYFAYGPYLAIAAIVALLWGGPILPWYPSP